MENWKRINENGKKGWMSKENKEMKKGQPEINVGINK